MKIAFLLTQSLESPSGLGRYGPLAREMANLGHTVEIIALHPAWNKLHPKTFIDSGVQVNYVGQMHVMKTGSRKTYYKSSQLLRISMMAISQMTKALRQSDAEIIQLCKPQPFNVLAARLGSKNRPVYCDCDDYEAETNRFNHNWQRSIVRYFEDNIINNVTGITVNTQFAFQRYKQLGFPAEHILYIPNGVERKRFTTISDKQDELRYRWHIKRDDPIIMYVGTLGLSSHPVDLLLEAFQHLLPLIPNAKLFLVGGGEDFDLLQQKVRDLKITEQTTFTGRVSPKIIPDYLAMATVTVDPIHNDLIAKARSPLKVIESLTMGTPVVTSDVGDRRLLLNNGKSGLLINAGDSIALANGLVEILQNKKARAFMTETALAYRDNWYWDRLIHQFLNIYH